MAARKNPKLAARYYGPFEVLAGIGEVAYKLRVPKGSQLHPVIHVSQLKQGTPPSNQITPIAPLTGKDGEPLAGPETILDSRIIQKRRTEVKEVLVKWINLPEEAATWVHQQVLYVQYPEFTP